MDDGVDMCIVPHRPQPFKWDLAMIVAIIC